MTFISSLFIEDSKPTSCDLIKLYLDKTILPFLISSPFFLTFFYKIANNLVCNRNFWIN